MANKIGVSTAVASIVLVLLTLVAAGIIVQFVVPFVKNGLAQSSECVNYKDYFDFDDTFGYNCKNQNGNYTFSISAKGESDFDSKISGFIISFEGNKQRSERVKKNQSVGAISMINITESKIKIPRPGETFSYILSSEIDEIYDEAQVNPIIIVSSGERVCDSVNKMGVKKC